MYKKHKTKIKIKGLYLWMHQIHSPMLKISLKYDVKLQFRPVCAQKLCY